MTEFEMRWKAREIWRDRNALINLRLDYGAEHGADETYYRIGEDIEQMAQEAESLERGEIPAAWIVPTTSGIRGDAAAMPSSFEGLRRLQPAEPEGRG